MKRSILGIFSLASTLSGATLYLDHEVDSIPVVSVTVVIPTGSLAYTREEAGVLSLVTDIFDQGNSELDRENFYNELARFGANTSFSVGGETTTWSMGFPYQGDRDYSRLVKILASQFQSPRFNADSLKLSKIKLKSTLQSALDVDTSLVRITSNRLRAIRDFGVVPVTPDLVDGITLERVRSTFNNRYHREMDAWVGFVGPKEALPMVETALAEIFPRYGAIKRGILKTPLQLEARRKVDLAQYQTALIIDRKDRNQTVTSFTWLKEGTPKNFTDAISHNFGTYLLAGSGLNSFFGEEIRTKRGLAYAVGEIDDVYLGHSIVGILTNPQRARNAEATEVISDAIKNAYEDAGYFSVMDAKHWKVQFRSFQYNTILSERTADGRLYRRMLLAMGEMNPDFALSNSSSWKVTQKDAAQYYKSRFGGSSRILAMVGDVAELRPLIEKSFPYYKIISVPYRDLLQLKTLENLAKELK